MVYEVKRDEVTQEEWAEMKKIVRENVCPDCGADLQIHTNPEKATLEVGCLVPGHHGYMERETYTQAFRRGEAVHPSIQAAIERRMVPRDELGRAMQRLAVRYPMAIVNPPTAALFIVDCSRLGLDALITPAEAVPIPFKSKKKDKDGKVIEEKTVVTMVITEDGWLSMAARGCKEDWVGPPRTMRIEEYLASLPENKKKTREEIQAIAREIKESQCKDPDAWYYVAIGKRRDGDDAVVPGYFTHPDHKKAELGYLPAASQPGNQARVRAIKRWVREVFPECRQRMMDMTAEWYQRAEGIEAAQEYIDAEYSFISIPEKPESVEKMGEKVGAAAPTKAQPKAKAQATKPLSTPAAEGESFSIDLPWLNESLKELKWTTDTAKTFLVSQYKVSPEGTLEDVLKRLTREQAEEFVKEIQDRTAKKQMELFD